MFDEVFWQQFWAQFFGGISAGLVLAALTAGATYLSRKKIRETFERYLGKITK